MSKESSTASSSGSVFDEPSIAASIKKIDDCARKAPVDYFAEQAWTMANVHRMFINHFKSQYDVSALRTRPAAGADSGRVSESPGRPQVRLQGLPFLQLDVSATRRAYSTATDSKPCDSGVENLDHHHALEENTIFPRPSLLSRLA